MQNNMASSTYELESEHPLMPTFKKKTKNSTPKQKPRQKAIAIPTTTPIVVTPTTTGSKIPKTPSPEKKPMDIEALNKKLDKVGIRCICVGVCSCVCVCMCVYVCVSTFTQYC